MSPTYLVLTTPLFGFGFSYTPAVGQTTLYWQPACAEASATGPPRSTPAKPSTGARTAAARRFMRMMGSAPGESTACQAHDDRLGYVRATGCGRRRGPVPHGTPRTPPGSASVNGEPVALGAGEREHRAERAVLQRSDILRSRRHQLLAQH